MIVSRSQQARLNATALIREIEGSLFIMVPFSWGGLDGTRLLIAVGSFGDGCDDLGVGGSGIVLWFPMLMVFFFQLIRGLSACNQLKPSTVGVDSSSLITKNSVGAS